MKKFLVGVVIVMLGIHNAKGVFLEVKDDNSFYNVKLEEVVKRKNGINSYLVSFTGNWNDDDKKQIKNLAYVGRNTDNQVYQGVIAKTILEVNNKDLQITLKNDWLDDIDISFYENKLAMELAEIQSGHQLAGKSYDVDLHDLLKITGDFGDLELNSDLTVENYGDRLVISNTNKPGFYKIYAKSKMDVIDNFITSLTPACDDFVINIRVLGKEIKFVSPKKNYYVNFLVLDEQRNVIDNIIINKDNTSFYYMKKQKLYFQDITNDNGYERLEEIAFVDVGNSYYELNLDLQENINYVKVQTILVDARNKDNNQYILNDFVVYDDQFKEINECHEMNCQLELKSGIYIFKDKKSKKMLRYDIFGDMEINLERYKINGIVSEEVLTKIKVDNNLQDFYKEGNLYYLDGLSDCSSISFLIDDDWYTWNLEGNEDYVFWDDLGTFWLLDLDKTIKTIKPEEIIIEDKNKKEEKWEDTIDISVPNTGIEIIGGSIYVYKKRNYHNTFTSFMWL